MEQTTDKCKSSVERACFVAIDQKVAENELNAVISYAFGLCVSGVDITRNILWFDIVFSSYVKQNSLKSLLMFIRPVAIFKNTVTMQTSSKFLCSEYIFETRNSFT